jgi:tagaturonate reductase
LKILQFGTGRFLRGFFASIVKEKRSITVVQSRTNSTGAKAINSQPEGYHVWTRGKQNGETIDSTKWVESIENALVAKTQWEELKTTAVSTELALVVSNTTAAGIALDDSDNEKDFRSECPDSYPAKLAALLFLRFEQSLPAVTVLPLELIEQNADQLKELVLKQSSQWETTNVPEFLTWLTEEVRWLNNLVDRIVVAPSDPPPWDRTDDLAVVGEPFSMLAIQDDGRGTAPIPDHEMITWTKDLSPFFLRKVRILNGLHTSMVAKFLPQGITTVLQAVSEPDSRRWVQELLNEEILPALTSLGLDETKFAADVIERFENPFFEHKLADIANGHESKLPVRVQPTFDDFVNAFGETPAKLNEVLQINLAEALG